MRAVNEESEIQRDGLLKAVATAVDFSAIVANSPDKCTLSTRSSKSKHSDLVAMLFEQVTTILAFLIAEIFAGIQDSNVSETHFVAWHAEANTRAL